MTTLKNSYRKLICSLLTLVWSISLVVAAEKVEENGPDAGAGVGEEYDGVLRQDVVKEAETAKRLGATVAPSESVVVDVLSPLLLGYNWNWYQVQDFVLEGTTDWNPQLLDVCEGLPMPLNRMSGTVSRYFRWKEAIGPVEQRKAFNPRRGYKGFPRVGLVEWIQLCRKIDPDARISFTLNILKGKPRDGADLAEFLCGDGSGNPNGGVNWARKRIEYGLADPVPVVIWELGNEEDHGLGWTAEQYVDVSRGFIDAIREVLPEARFCAHVSGSPWNRKRHPTLKEWRSWHRHVLEKLGADIDWLAFHPYYEGVSTAAIERYTRMLHEDIEDICPGQGIQLYFSEHGKWPGRRKLSEEMKRRGRTRGPLDFQDSHTLAGCLAVGDFLLRNARLPYAEAAACHSFRAGPWAFVRYDKATKTFYRTAMCDLFILLNQVKNWDVLKTGVSGHRTRLEDNRHGATFLALAFKKGDRMALLTINKLPNTVRDVTVNLETSRTLVGEYTLTGPELASYNTLTEQPVRLTYEKTSGDAPFAQVTVPAKSIKLYMLEMR